MQRFQVYALAALALPETADLAAGLLATFFRTALSAAFGSAFASVLRAGFFVAGAACCVSEGLAVALRAAAAGAA